MESLPDLSIGIDAVLEYLTFNTESINNYVSTIGSHISALSGCLPTLTQYLPEFPSVELLDQVDCSYILLAGGTKTQ